MNFITRFFKKLKQETLDVIYTDPESFPIDFYPEYLVVLEINPKNRFKQCLKYENHVNCFELIKDKQIVFVTFEVIANNNFNNLDNIDKYHHTFCKDLIYKRQQLRNYKSIVHYNDKKSDDKFKTLLTFLPSIGVKNFSYVATDVYNWNVLNNYSSRHGEYVSKISMTFNPVDTIKIPNNVDLSVLKSFKVKNFQNDTIYDENIPNDVLNCDLVQIGLNNQLNNKSIIDYAEIEDTDADRSTYHPVVTYISEFKIDFF